MPIINNNSKKSGSPKPNINLASVSKINNEKDLRLNEPTSDSDDN